MEAKSLEREPMPPEVVADLIITLMDTTYGWSLVRDDRGLETFQITMDGEAAELLRSWQVKECAKSELRITENQRAEIAA